MKRYRGLVNWQCSGYVYVNQMDSVSAHDDVVEMIDNGWMPVDYDVLHETMDVLATTEMEDEISSAS